MTKTNIREYILRDINTTLRTAAALTPNSEYCPAAQEAIIYTIELIKILEENDNKYLNTHKPAFIKLHKKLNAGLATILEIEKSPQRPPQDKIKTVQTVITQAQQEVRSLICNDYTPPQERRAGRDNY